MSDVKGKEKEQEREGEIKNEDIDLSRTKYNYDIVNSELNLYQRVKERVEYAKENGSRVQKNSVVMYSNILTVPEDTARKWGEEKTAKYFEACYEYFSNEFGKENVVSAKVHVDETTPHMHLHFVPFNKDTGKLQARVAMNKAKINDIHNSLPAFLQEKGFDVVRGAGKTKGKNIENVHEYKEIKRKIELEKSKLEELEIEKIGLLSEIGYKKFEVTEAVADLEKKYNDELQTYQFKLSNQKKQIEEDTNKEVEKIELKILTANTDFDLINKQLQEFKKKHDLEINELNKELRDYKLALIDTVSNLEKEHESTKQALNDDLNTFKADLSDLKDKAQQEHENDLEMLKMSYKAKKQELEEQVFTDVQLIKSKITDAQTDFDMINQELAQIKLKQEQELERYKLDLVASKKEIKVQLDKELKELKEKQEELLADNEQLDKTKKQLETINNFNFSSLSLNQATLDYFEGMGTRLDDLEGSVVIDEDNQVKLSIDDFKELISVSKTSTENFKIAFKRTLDYREVNQSKNLIKSLYDNSLSTIDDLNTRNDELMRFPKFIEEEGLVPRYNSWFRDKKKQKEVQREKDDGLDL